MPPLEWMMKVSDCPDCGGSDLYRSVATTSAKGLFGPDLLPNLEWGQLRVVVCKDCGLTRFFASNMDRQALSTGAWERIVEGAGPLGINRP
jgi:predicted nucleic-acid-binding Zn-ribbon protein